MSGIAAEIFQRVISASAGEIALAVALSLGAVIVSFGVTALLLVRLPADYFVAKKRPRPLAGRSPAIQIAAIVARNLAGVALVVLGVLLSLPGVPGQGILTILLGIMLLDIPGKRRLEGAIVRRRVVHRAINRLRSRFQKPPIVLPKIRHA
ncbi:MAG: hypothetical protein HOV80_06575 [Polyangiaceae bacterium]|nr:hypothetical protein [Polyangiaceae bacterium]